MDFRSSAFDQLDDRIRRWIWEQGWTELRDAQERAIAPVLAGDRDVIVAAATASGKTEAAFLPILTRLAREEEGATLAIYISPLKALINDQWGRLDLLCERLGVPVIPWHGDIGQPRKKAFLKRPHGVLLITPESVEALFVRRGYETHRLFASLSYIVIDELHAFIGSDRGKQLQSLLYRIEVAAGRRIPRVGLSATLGDMSLAADFLRRGEAGSVDVIVSTEGELDLRVQVRGYIETLKPRVDADGVELDPTPQHRIADHLYQVLRGTNNLVFPNSRRAVEIYADLLRSKCEADQVPLEFWPHHGSLSKSLREETEQALKDGTRPATGVCTTTLELGIDIGAIRCVAQIGAAPSVASLRQRLGRSGRRQGTPAILRGYAIESEVDHRSSLSDQLREGLVQQIAQIQLLMGRWFEPPRAQGLHLSTLVQQILSVIAERSGIEAKPLYELLVTRGAFLGLPVADFAQLLRALAAEDLIVQDVSGALLPGSKGELLINHYDFYAAFVSGEEWTIDAEGRSMGTLPISSPLVVGVRLIFAGRRWRVVGIDEPARRVAVVPDRSGKPPQFDGGSGFTHARVRQQMRELLAGNQQPGFLDETATMLLAEARTRYHDLRLDKYMTLLNGASLALITWAGDDALMALTLLLKARGVNAEHEGLTIEVEGKKSDLCFEALEAIANMPISAMHSCLRDAANLAIGKWDWALPRSMLEKNYASMHLDYSGASGVAKQILKTASANGNSFQI